MDDVTKKVQYVAGAIARSQGMYPTQFGLFIKHAKAAIKSYEFYTRKYSKQSIVSTKLRKVGTIVKARKVSKSVTLIPCGDARCCSTR